MEIRNLLRAITYKFKSQDQKLISGSLCGVPLKTTPGTIRENVDQDDSWWFQLCKHHNIIFDVGANIGYTALLALIQNPNRQIVLVDPNPKALQLAAANIIRNKLGSRAQYLTAFVGNKQNDTIKFYTVGSGAAGSMHPSHAKTASSIDSYMEVNTVTLDYIYEFYGMQPDLVKIDIEGAETIAIQAAKVLAAETQCSFFIEMHDVTNLGMESAVQIMLDWGEEVGYKVWYPKTGQELTDTETIKNRGKCHLLLLPKFKPYPDYLKGIKQNAALPESI